MEKMPTFHHLFSGWKKSLHLYPIPRNAKNLRLLRQRQDGVSTEKHHLPGQNRSFRGTKVSTSDCIWLQYRDIERESGRRRERDSARFVSILYCIVCRTIIQTRDKNWFVAGTLVAIIFKMICTLVAIIIRPLQNDSILAANTKCYIHHTNDNYIKI